MIWVYNKTRDSLTFTPYKGFRFVFPSIGTGIALGCDISPWGSGRQISSEQYEMLRKDSEFMRHVKLGRLKVSDCSWSEYFSGTQSSKERLRDKKGKGSKKSSK